MRHRVNELLHVEIEASSDVRIASALPVMRELSGGQMYETATIRSARRERTALSSSLTTLFRLN
jgi:hypothetical protein